MQIKLIKYSDDLQMPSRKHSNDAGLDIHLLDYVVFEPNETKILNTGFGLELPTGVAAYVIERSSIAIKGIKSTMSPVDSSYRGEIHLILTNTSNKVLSFDKGDRIAQLVVLPVIIANLTLADEKTRGNNGLGSTGK